MLLRIPLLFTQQFIRRRPEMEPCCEAGLTPGPMACIKRMHAAVERRTRRAGIGGGARGAGGAGGGSLVHDRPPAASAELRSVCVLGSRPRREGSCTPPSATGTFWACPPTKIGLTFLYVAFSLSFSLSLCLSLTYLLSISASVSASLHLTLSVNPHLSTSLSFTLSSSLPLSLALLSSMDEVKWSVVVLNVSLIVRWRLLRLPGADQGRRFKQIPPSLAFQGAGWINLWCFLKSSN